MKLVKSFRSILNINLFFLLLFSSSVSYPQAAPENSAKLSLGDKSLNFLVISDWGRDGTKEKGKDKKAVGQVLVAKQFGETAKEINASFVVTCGDNFHGKGVPSSTDPFWSENFENVFTNQSLMIPWYITLGNHDYEGNVEAELEYAKTSKRWIQPARYYSFIKNLSNSSVVLFVILDSSPFIQEYQKDMKDGHHINLQDREKQVQWCDSVLSHTNAKWKFVFFHHPAYSASTTHGSTKEIQNIFVPLFEKYHVDACFSGHDHDLQHSHPDKSPVEYFGTGGGSDMRPAGHEDFTKFSVSSLGFGAVSLTQNEMKFSFINDKGEQIYTYSIHK